MSMPSSSAKLQLLRGNPNNKSIGELEKRAEKEEKMMVKLVEIKPPSFLDTAGKNEYIRVATILNETEVISETDINMLAIYCDAFSNYIKFGKEIKKTGLWVNGNPNPFILRQKQAAELMRTIANDFGLTPTSRAKLAIKMSSDESDEDDFNNY